MRIPFGSKTVAMLNEAGEGKIVDTTYRGNVVKTITTYRVSVMIGDEPQLLAEILKHLEFCKHPDRLDPAFEMDTDLKTGNIKRIVKIWREISY